MSLAIRIENLGKCYHIDHAVQRGEYQTLRETLSRAATAPLRRLRHGFTGQGEDFWALRDVSFDVTHGESVGIIGRNGAGKSTLLKILSQITKPTTGCVKLYGRVASLLEVGTGFHPELTGRENIYLNGSILGMRHADTRRKFDEIVAFSGVDKFLDTPIKRYSSGMKVRLAFSVAAHLEPEILIIDEVLAVGDADFQKRCIGKMGEVSRSGRTVLFVSHNMAAVQSLCSHAIELRQGALTNRGQVGDVLEAYRKSVFGGSSLDCSRSQLDGRFFRDAHLVDESDSPTAFIPLGGQFHLRVVAATKETIRNPTIGIGIDSSYGERLLTVHTPASAGVLESLSGTSEVHCRIKSFPLAPGRYSIKLALSDSGQLLESLEPVVPFSVVESAPDGDTRGFTRGMCIAPSEWWIRRTVQVLP